MADLLLETLADEVDETALLDLFGLDHPLFDAEAAASALPSLSVDPTHARPVDVAYDVDAAVAALPPPRYPARYFPPRHPHVIFDALPDELIKNILSFLQDGSLFAATLLCQKVNRIVLPILYKRLWLVLDSDTEIRPELQGLLLPGNRSNLRYVEEVQLSPRTGKSISAAVCTWIRELLLSLKANRLLRFR